MWRVHRVCTDFTTRMAEIRARNGTTASWLSHPFHPFNSTSPATCCTPRSSFISILLLLRRVMLEDDAYDAFSCIRDANRVLSSCIRALGQIKHSENGYPKKEIKKRICPPVSSMQQPPQFCLSPLCGIFSSLEISCIKRRPFPQGDVDGFSYASTWLQMAFSKFVDPQISKYLPQPDLNVWIDSH